MATDAVINGLAVDGVDVTKVVHFGESIPAHVRTALAVRDPVCVVPGCTVRYPLEIDHAQPRAEDGPTCLDNLSRLCHQHHCLETFKGYRLWRKGDRWCWQPPIGRGTRRRLARVETQPSTNRSSDRTDRRLGHRRRTARSMGCGLSEPGSRGRRAGFPASSAGEP